MYFVHKMSSAAHTWGAIWNSRVTILNFVTTQLKRSIAGAAHFMDRQKKRRIGNVFWCYERLRHGTIWVFIREILFLNMRRGGLIEQYHKPTEVRPLSIRLSVFTYVLVLVGREVEQGDRGEGARENKGQERDLSERESGKRNLKKKTLVFCL